MKIVITGGTGFIGHHLTSHLSNLGHEMIMIQRSDLRDGADRISKLIKSTDVLINLAGSPVIKRWTDSNRKEILASRLNTTRILVEALHSISPAQRPSVVLSASAIGIYNSSKIHSEQSVDFDDNFLAGVCEQWERSLEPLNDLQIRVNILRIGIVLGTDGGMLKRLIPIFRAGLGGKIGTGSQGFSFIHYLDLCRAVEFLIENEQCVGIYNLTSPDHTTNGYFTTVLARELHRPAFFHVPEAAVRLLYGRASVALLKGQFVYPRHLLECGFKFQFKDIDTALKSLLVSSQANVRH
jgi:uncharacterized protein (TIGR01777 family)